MLACPAAISAKDQKGSTRQTKPIKKTKKDVEFQKTTF